MAYSIVARQVERRYEYAAAQELYERGLAADPTYGPTLEHFADFYIRMFEPEKARELLLRSLQGPQQFALWRASGLYAGLSMVAFMQGRADEAIQWAQRAIDAEPDGPDGHFRLAMGYALKGDEANTRRIASTLRQRWPEVFDRRLTAWVDGDYPPGKKEAVETFKQTRLLPARRMIGLRVD